jgi:hypothetical protein
VLLGATSAEGLPQTLFQGGEARWIEVRSIEVQLIAASGGDAVAEVANATPPARSLLSVSSVLCLSMLNAFAAYDLNYRHTNDLEVELQ